MAGQQAVVIITRLRRAAAAMWAWCKRMGA